MDSIVKITDMLLATGPRLGFILLAVLVVASAFEIFIRAVAWVGKRIIRKVKHGRTH